jgi:hypothetical protein
MPRRNIKFKSSVLKNVNNDVHAKMFVKGGDKKQARAVEDVTYTDDMDTSYLVEDMHIQKTLKDVFERATIASTTPSTRNAFLELFTSPEMEQMSLSIFFYSFTKYFSHTEAYLRDDLVAQVSKCYTQLSAKLGLAFPPINGTMLRKEKDSFMMALPFLLGELVFVLLHLCFPASALHFQTGFRNRLDIDFTLLLGGVKLCSTTQTKEKERMYGTRAFAWDLRKSRPVGSQPHDYSDYSTDDESDEEIESAAQSSSTLSPLPLQQEMEQEELERESRQMNTRLRPRQVKFNTNLMSPVMQRGLERWTAIPTWRSQRMISHAMPLDDSKLGGENTYVPIMSPLWMAHQDRLLADCLSIRDTVDGKARKSPPKYLTSTESPAKALELGFEPSLRRQKSDLKVLNFDMNAQQTHLQLI